MDTTTTPHSSHVLPSPSEIQKARSSLIHTLPTTGLGLSHIQTHIQHDLVPGFTRASKSAHYYGFVTGGTTPASVFADHVAVDTDQTVQVHLPNESVGTDVEDAALRMLCDLLDLRDEEWSHRTFTTGATASNVLGLACGREFVLQRAAVSAGKEVSVADKGIVNAMRTAGVEEIQILTTVPHSSLRKAASVVGLGRSSLRDVSLKTSPHRFDISALQSALRKPKTASIVSVSCSEVNTGFFATTGSEMQQLRQLCDEHGAWLHVDAAFGLLARVLPQHAEYNDILEGVVGLELADSIAGDAHKLLNVPYDCGIFLSKHLQVGTHVFQNTGAAYLNAPTSNGNSSQRVIPSPLNIGLENSRRFRALPVYATLAAYGQDGYRDMLERQIHLAREIAKYISSSSDYELLPKGIKEDSIYIIVLFRAKNDEINTQLVQRINATRKIYVSGTQWDGRPAARFAVANWMVDVDRDIALIKEVLTQILT